MDSNCAVISCATPPPSGVRVQLDDASGPGRFLLRQSIAFETLVIAGVLTATALLTTFTSPHT